MGLLEGRVAIVTGGGRGIGRGIAKRFASEGASVAIATRTASSGNEVVAEITEAGGVAFAVQCDVGDREAVDAMVSEVFARFGTVHILVNNAQSFTGGSKSLIRTPIEDYPEEWWEDTLRSGLYGTWYCSRAVLPAMKEQGYGKIINFGSSGGVYGYAGLVAYNCTKEAIRSLTKTAAREWGPYGIRVNVVCPILETDSLREARANNPDAPAASPSVIPLGYFGDAERDGGGLAVYLAGADSDYLTGQTIFLDGGWHFF